MIGAVPADVCDTCGEDDIESAVLKQLETLMDVATESGVRFEIREYAA